MSALPGVLSMWGIDGQRFATMLGRLQSLVRTKKDQRIYDALRLGSCDMLLNAGFGTFNMLEAINPVCSAVAFSALLCEAGALDQSS